MKSQQLIEMVESLFPNLIFKEIVSFSLRKSTFKVINKDSSTPQVLKLFFPNQEKQIKPQKLIRALRSVNQQKSPFLLQHYELVFDASMTYIVLIEEQQTVNLKNLLKQQKEPFSEGSIWKILKNLCDALSIWHKSGIVHNRVKPSSVYLNKQGQCILGEPDILYLLSKEISYENMFYQSQETLTLQLLDQKADVWSLGVLLYEMMTQVLPYKGKDVNTVKKIMQAEYTQLDLLKVIEKKYSRNLNKLVLAMLSLDHSLRPTLEQVKYFVTMAISFNDEISSQYILDNYPREISNNYVEELVKFIENLPEPPDQSNQTTSLTGFNHYAGMSKIFFRPGQIRKQPLVQSHKILPKDIGFQILRTEEVEVVENRTNSFKEPNKLKNKFYMKNENTNRIFHRTDESNVNFTKTTTPKIKQLNEKIKKETASQAIKQFRYSSTTPQLKLTSLNFNLMASKTSHFSNIKLAPILKNKEIFLHSVLQKFYIRQNEQVSRQK